MSINETRPGKGGEAERITESKKLHKKFSKICGIATDQVRVLVKILLYT
jgi:hypothetical protein